MFDYRYHALSLAAVLLALAVGVLLGVAIGDSNLVSSAKNGVVHELRSNVSGARQQADQLRGQLATEQTLEQDLYPIAVHGLLNNRSIGLVFLGSPSDQVNELARDAITQAGGDLVAVVAIREPLDLAGLAREAAATPSGAHYVALASSPHLVKQFGKRMAIQLISGGQLLPQVQARLLSSSDGQLGKLDGLVVVRGEPHAMTEEQTQTADEFQSGLLGGAAVRKTPVVGVELSSTNPSQVPWYKSHDIASVDDLDMLAGRAAVVFALNGAHGAYGTKPTADSLLPNVAHSFSLP
jgi:Copper transport outer membrane protein, MctB